ncbi:hypothetical protein GCM10007094_39050 [Pseudovibrio japonicus]|uniref:Uncharacterized protein n=1 Tax=Pseudovibrio japonicus TaxID=366534 RepID=A0ABQ3ELN3_9HYPH|nr:hypothetical protein GCM10007094_39050 [Pseudovibrio japonicus]
MIRLLAHRKEIYAIKLLDILMILYIRTKAFELGIFLIDQLNTVEASLASLGTQNSNSFERR